MGTHLRNMFGTFSRRVRNLFSVRFFKVVIGMTPPRCVAYRGGVPREAEEWDIFDIVESGDYRVGIFVLPFRGRNGSPLYRLSAWRLYLTRKGREGASTSLSAHDVEIVLQLMQRLRRPQ